MQLNRYLAASGITSRRKAETLISSGKITVNNQVILSPGFLLGPCDKVRLGKKIIKPEPPIYILLNKPKGVTSTCYDKFAKNTVISLVKIKIGEKRIYPVGRLDKDSTGLIILTNNGDFCYKITHPKFNVEKDYLIELNRPLSKPDIKSALEGVIDQTDKLKIKKIKFLKKNTLTVTINEGKKRHLRRLFAKLGYQVESLKRVKIGNFHLGSLKEGEFKVFNHSQIKKRGYG